MDNQYICLALGTCTYIHTLIALTYMDKHVSGSGHKSAEQQHILIYAEILILVSVSWPSSWSCF